MATPGAILAKKEATSAKLENQTYSGSVEVKDPWVYYDTYVLDASASPTVLFNNSSSKARSLSNYQYQQLPNGQAFDIWGLRLSYFSITALTDVNFLALTTFLAKAVLQVVINNKVPTYERNIGALLGGAMQVITAPAVTVNSQNASKWTADTVVTFRKRIKLDQSTQWTVNILKDAANGAGLTGDYLRVETIGVLTARL